MITHLSAEVWNAVNALCPAEGQFGNTVARLTHLGLEHQLEAQIVPTPDNAITTRTRLPRPDRLEIDKIKESMPGISLGLIVAALVAVGLRHAGHSLPDQPAATDQREEFMTAS